MSTKNMWIAGVAVLVIIAALIAYVHASKKEPAPQGAPMSASSTPGTGNAAVGASGQSQVITYTDSGFSPTAVTVAEGETVTWVNQSSGPMWVAVNNHPSHTGYDGTSREEHCINGAPDSAQVFDECTAVGSGGSFSFTFGKAGTWGYHNHAHESDQGTVTVVAGASVTAPVSPKG